MKKLIMTCWCFLAIAGTAAMACGQDVGQAARSDKPEAARQGGTQSRILEPRARMMPARATTIDPLVSVDKGFTKDRQRASAWPVFSASQHGNAGASLVEVQDVPNRIPFWPQWMLNPQHTGQVNVAGQALNQILAAVQYDPLVPDEEGMNGGNLLAHFEVPLIDGNDAYMESKAGTYTIDSYSTETWHQNKFSWINGQLTKIWTFDTDWTPPGSAFDFWEPVYQAALANGFLYDPGAGGTIFKISKLTGQAVKRINPFGNRVDPNKFTASPLSTDSSGNIYYNVIQLLNTTDDFFADDVVNSWLIRVSPNDTITKVQYSTLLSQAVVKGDPIPGPNDPCKVTFSDPPPWPPTPNAVPPTTPCGTQRPSINIAPAIAPDGTIYTVTKAHFVSRYNYLLAVNPNLTGKWAASFRGRLHDGCNDGTVQGSVLPVDGQPGGCAVGAHNGVDPEVNEPGPGRVYDDASATPTIAPDGSVFFGAYTRYNYAQGHLFHFSSSGNFLGAFGFGWDVTPAIYTHGNTYSVVIKNNHYSGLGSYCDDDTVCPPDRTSSNPNSPEAYFVTQLNRNLNIEWSFQSTNTQSCTRNPDGSITCVNDHPNGFEWCVNAPVVDSHGVVYANSEDGNLYAINQGGTLKQNIFQQQAIGAAYTPASLDANGKIYSQNQGMLFVVGGAFGPSAIARLTSLKR